VNNLPLSIFIPDWRTVGRYFARDNENNPENYGSIGLRLEVGHVTSVYDMLQTPFILTI